MRGLSIEERAIAVAQYIIETEDTVRGAAKKFGISKSSIHKDVSQRLLNINYALAMEVRKVLDKNKAERHKVLPFLPEAHAPQRDQII